MAAEEENKALYRRFFEEAVNQGNMETVQELIAPNYVNYNFPGVLHGPEGMRQVISTFRAAFPDMRVSPEQVFAEGDTVIGRGSWEGTHQGAFQGIAPSGVPVKVPYIDIWCVEDGKFVENWVQMDMLGLMQQIGAFTPPLSPSGLLVCPLARSRRQRGRRLGLTLRPHVEDGLYLSLAPVGVAPSRCSVRRKPRGLWDLASEKEPDENAESTKRYPR